jgi:hypothetical protein
MNKIADNVLAALGLADLPEPKPIEGERRREYRRPVDLPAVCEVMEPYKRLDCRVADISNSGARLVFDSIGEVPNSFRLYILQLNFILECQVAWRRENSLGVSFTPIQYASR